MRLSIEPGDAELTAVKCGWHSWDLSDCIVPKFFDADEDIEEDWATFVAIVPKAVADQLVTALNSWTFEAIKNGSEELETTDFGKEFNRLLQQASDAGDWTNQVSAIVQYAAQHHVEHLKLIMNK